MPDENPENTSMESISALSTFLEKHRLLLSKLVVGLIIVLLVFAKPIWSFGAGTLWLLDSLALLLLLIACLGRMWCTMYIGGHKNTNVVQSGPYSMVRNPLYFFSFIGALGVALLTHSIIISLLLMVFFVGIYPFVIAKEENNLLGFFGEEYEHYRTTTPRFLPAPKQYTSNNKTSADIPRMERALFDSGCFVLVFILLSGIRLGHQTGWIPTFISLP